MRTESEDAALAVLGVARRAGRLEVGTQAVRDAARRGRLTAILLAGDASANGRRRIEHAAREAGVPIHAVADREELGRAVGRGPVAVVGLTDAGLTELVRRRLAGNRAPERPQQEVQSTLRLED